MKLWYEERFTVEKKEQTFRGTAEPSCLLCGDAVYYSEEAFLINNHAEKGITWNEQSRSNFFRNGQWIHIRCMKPVADAYFRVQLGIL